MNEEKRLKRGLGDVSQLFASTSRPAEEKPAEPPAGAGAAFSAFQCMAAAAPSEPAHHALLVQTLAAQLASLRRGLTVLSLPPLPARRSEKRAAVIMEPNARHFQVSWDEMQSFLRGAAAHAERFVPRPEMLLLDFDPEHPAYFEKLLPVMDRYILLASPTLESLSETYRMVKSAHAANKKLEFGLLINAVPEDPRAPLLFEKMSQMISARLGIQLNWLGTLRLSAEGGSGPAQFSVAPMLARPAERLESVERIALAASCKDLAARMPESLYR